jgi:hypothetical protein
MSFLDSNMKYKVGFLYNHHNKVVNIDFVSQRCGAFHPRSGFVSSEVRSFFTGSSADFHRGFGGISS